MAKTVERGGNIALQWDHVLEEVIGDVSGVTGIRIKNVKSDITREINLPGCSLL